MKEEMTSVDIAAVIKELKSLEGAKLEKAYQHSMNEIRLKLSTKDGKRDLLLQAGRRIHLTEKPSKAPAIPPSFPMLLRKELKGARILKLEQHNFDRIVVIEFGRGDSKSFLICEFFAKGNIVLVDNGENVIMPLRTTKTHTRDVMRGIHYQYPLPQFDPTDISFEEFNNFMRFLSRDIVRTLATKFNMGGTYAEETCLRAGVEKNKRELSDTEIKELYKALKKIFEPLLSDTLKPHTVFDDSRPIDVLPFELRFYDGYDKLYYESFNEALDAYFQSDIEEKIVTSPRQSQLIRILDQQKKAIERFKENELDFRSKGEIIYSEYSDIDKLINAVRTVRKTKSWNEISSELSKISCVTQIDPRSSTITVNVRDANIEINVNYSVAQNAQNYYEKAKTAKEKREGAEVALQNTLKKIDDASRAKEVKRNSERVYQKKRKVRWYERFRWYISSDAFLVIGGRDADTNEEIVKKYMEPRDLVFHAQIRGAPIVIIKSEGREIPETTLREAAQFAIAYSAVWKEGLHSGDCYWVYPNQVSKTPESGEYLARGAFVIRGERHYMRAPAQIAIGVDAEKVIGGPIEAISSSAKYFVVLEPGKYNQNDISKRIARELLRMATSNDKKSIKLFLTIDHVAKFVPSGTSDIVT
jgi:predicted ribosome quality control (RQC) complex YloA/Tae2 family protein